MARKARLFFDDIAIHITVRGINSENIFRDSLDYSFYKEILEDISKSTHVNVHAYALLPKNIQLLCTFANKDALSRFMQSLGLKYVSYFNKKYHRSGTLWEGRYKSSLVEDAFILPVMQYIEETSLREKLVEKLSTYAYCSFPKNALNINDTIITPHSMYKLLGKDEQDRASIYNSIFATSPLEETMVSFIDNHLSKQTIIGSLEFCQKLEAMAGETLMEKKRGRPKKNLKQGSNMSSKPVILDKKIHKTLKVSPLENLNFAKTLSFVPILANETAAVAEMFPVVFTADEKPSLVSLTSLGDGNLAINSEGKYISRYVPAYLRKYPFSLASTKENPEKKVVLIDEQASNVSKTKGKQLFTKDGEQSEVLKTAITFLTDYDKQFTNTRTILKIIKDSGILEDREISVGEGDEKKVLVNGFQVVNRDKLNKLGDEMLATWVRKGIISFIDSHINSLTKMDNLFKLSSQKQKS